MNKHRIGRFYVSLNLIHEHHEDIVNMFKTLSIIVIRAEMMYQRDAIEYIGISPNFKEVQQNYVTPEYTLVMHRNDNSEIVYSIKDYELFDKEVIVK